MIVSYDQTQGAIMNQKLRVVARLLGLVLLLSAAELRASAQTQNPQTNPADAVQTQNQQQINQPNQTPALIDQLNLTPEQIQKWRAVNLGLRSEQQAATQRLRQARRALADAVESGSPNEEVIKQRAHEVSDAQAAIIQLQALREARMLQILTPEQRVKLREIRQRQQAIRRAENQQGQRNIAGRQNGLPRNTNSPQTLKPNQRKLMKQQQKP